MHVTNIAPKATIYLKPVNEHNLDKEQKSLKENLKVVNNCIKSLNQERATIVKEYNIANSVSQKINSLQIKNSNPEAILRLKGTKFKSDEGSNFIKNMINGKRYAVEQQQASKFFNGSGSTISITKASQKADQDLGAVKEKLQYIDNEIETITTQREIFYERLDSIKHNIVKKTNSQSVQKTKVITKAEKLNPEARAIMKNFTLTYSSSDAAKNINEIARAIFMGEGQTELPKNIKGSEVIRNYERQMGDSCISKEHKFAIKSYCSDLHKNVYDAAVALYTPSKTNVTTYHGRVLTSEKFEEMKTFHHLNKQNGRALTYNAGQFFSTTPRIDTANFFMCAKTPGLENVMFKITGNSGNPLEYPEKFSAYNYELEHIYSPLTDFQVSNIYKDKDGKNVVELVEVQKERTQIESLSDPQKQTIYAPFPA